MLTWLTVIESSSATTHVRPSACISQGGVKSSSVTPKRSIFPESVGINVPDFSRLSHLSEALANTAAV